MLQTLSIINEKGLHARASAKFVETVEQFDARAVVRSLNLRNWDEWTALTKSTRHTHVPAYPSRYYQTTGWVSNSDWIGNGRDRRLGSATANAGGARTSPREFREMVSCVPDTISHRLLLPPRGQQCEDFTSAAATEKMTTTASLRRR